MSISPETIADLAITPISDVSGRVTIGTGDAQSMYNATTAQLLSVIDGTSLSPDTDANPLVKVTRTVQLQETDVSGDGVENMSAILGVCAGTDTCQTQTVGVAGMAKTTSTSGHPGNDACGLYGVGRTRGSGTGVGIGGFFNGRRDSSSGSALGVEISCDDAGGAASSYTSTAFPSTTGVWLHATSGDCAAGLVFANNFGYQFDVGLAFNGQVSGGKTGGIINTSIRDDSTSATSLLIKGSHSTAAIAIDAGAGGVAVGETSLVNSTSQLEVMGPDSTCDPLVVFGKVTGGSARSYSVWLRNVGHAGTKWWVSGGANNFVTGSDTGDSGIALQVAGSKFMLGGSSTTQVLTVEHTGTGQIGFFKSTTVAQQSTTGTSTGFTTGSGTAVKDDSTFTGGSGSTAYRVSDIVLALKNYGLLAV